MIDSWFESLKVAFGGFAWPWMWLAFPLPWLAGWLLPPHRNTSVALKVPYGRRLDAIATVGGRSRHLHIAALAWLAWFLLCAAAARPQQLGEAVAPPQSGRDLMLAVDLSGSMSEPDMELGGNVVDRLTAAKAVLADFLDRRVGDRVGLLVFGQRAYALTPLTLDRDSVRDQLRDSVAGLAGRETAIGDAIGLAVKRLRDQPNGQRVLILLTDGVNTAGVLEPLKAAELAKAEGVRIHTIAFGGSGGGLSIFGLNLPMPGGGDEIDEETLKKIAQETGGQSFRARDTEQLAGIYAELDRIEPVKQEGARVRPRVERYGWPLAAALLVALFAFLLPRRMR
ncbi:vWA domain-containing protein [Pseudoxanthomonas sacheonensis]|uniref:Ca-activated chloride channel family protein n=1 Tax=Pseudoxanthomonas sacheonensis TaxID=443615 RepID=A0ABU1RLX8_9GAMM|nr:VWA domain-containing protein [Pseudoxanthomonas sacheonensis]MDR6839781.1 Ca-activated chloride channel family protein [Pseudoxanthomonas sacheonensis]